MGIPAQYIECTYPGFPLMACMGTYLKLHPWYVHGKSNARADARLRDGPPGYIRGYWGLFTHHVILHVSAAGSQWLLSFLY